MPLSKEVPAHEFPCDFYGQRLTEGNHIVALDRVLNQSTMSHIPLLREDFAFVVGKGQWVVLPYSVAKELPGLRLILLGVK